MCEPHANPAGPLALPSARTRRSDPLRQDDWMERTLVAVLSTSAEELSGDEHAAFIQNVADLLVQTLDQKSALKIRPSIPTPEIPHV